MSGRIIRKKKKSNYTTISNVPLEDLSLSWKAKGLLTYMLSMPDNWQFYVKDLENRSKDGRDSTLSGLKELEKAGYIVKEKKRDDDGKFLGYDYLVYESPVNGKPVNGKPVNGKPVNGKPVNGKPVTTKDSIELNTKDTKYLKEEEIKNLIVPSFKDSRIKDNFEETVKNFGLSLDPKESTPFDELNENLKKEKEKSFAKKEKLEDLEYHQETIEILALFTELTGVNFKPPKSVSNFKRYGAYKMVKSLLKRGFKLRGIEDVIKFKCKEWLSSAKMAQYCTYQTILLPSNFEKYLIQIQIKPTTNGKQKQNVSIEEALNWFNDESSQENK